MKETKIIKDVQPNDVNSTIEKWADFGWELMGAPQETYNKTVHRTQETDEHYASEYTSTTHYFTISFQREKSISSYNELVTLEQQYDSLKFPSNPIMPVRFGMIWGILIAIGLLFFPISILIIIWRLVRYSKKKKIYNAEYAEWEKACGKIRNDKSEIRKKARSLLQ